MIPRTDESTSTRKYKFVTEFLACPRSLSYRREPHHCRDVKSELGVPTVTVQLELRRKRAAANFDPTSRSTDNSKQRLSLVLIQDPYFYLLLFDPPLRFPHYMI